MPHNIYIKYKIRIQCIGARAYTNNLPLALVPIEHSPKIEGPNITLMFWPSNCLVNGSTTLFSPEIFHIFTSSLSTIFRMRWNLLSMCLEIGRAHV